MFSCSLGRSADPLAESDTAVMAESGQRAEPIKTSGKGEEYGTVEPGSLMRSPAAKVDCRDAFWDNCKGLGQLFVISQHLHLVVRLMPDLQHMTIDNNLEHGYFIVIYCLTVPGFAFISGLFTETKSSTGSVLRQFKYMALFLLHHVLYLALLWTEYKKPVPFFQSSGVEWFLLSLVIWRGLTPLIDQLRWPITTSVIFALFMMTTEASKDMHINATCLFLPFFVLGLTFRGHADGLKQERESLVIIRTVFIAIVVLMVISPALDSRPFAAVVSGMACFYGKSRFQFLRTPEFNMYNSAEQLSNPFMTPGSDYCQTYVGFANVLGLYVFSVFMITGIATCVPNRPVWILTKAGKHSLYIYLCHVYIAIFPCRQATKALTANGYGPYPHIGGVLVVVCMSFLFWMCLAGDWLRFVCFPCVEPPYEKFLLTDVRFREEVIAGV